MEGEEGGDGGDVGNQGNLSFQDGDAIHRESAGYTGIDMEYRDYHENTRRVVSRQLVTHLHLCLACVCVLVCGVCARVWCVCVCVCARRSYAYSCVHMDLCVWCGCVCACVCKRMCINGCTGYSRSLTT